MSKKLSVFPDEQGRLVFAAIYPIVEDFTGEIYFIDIETNAETYQRTVEFSGISTEQELVDKCLEFLARFKEVMAQHVEVTEIDNPEYVLQ